MDITLLVAKVLGIDLMISGIILVLKPNSLRTLLKDFFEHPAIVYLTGTILIFLASVYLLQYNSWESMPQKVVTVCVWLIGLKGLNFLFFPQQLNDFIIKRGKSFFIIYGGVIAVLLGLYLFLLK